MSVKNRRADGIKQATITMKKVTLITTLILFATFTITSCEDSTQCACQEFDASTGALVGSGTVDPEDYNAKSCTGVELNLRTATQSEFLYKCSEVK